MDWFNNGRLLERIGSVPPVEAEANFYAGSHQGALPVRMVAVGAGVSRISPILKKTLRNAAVA